MKRLSTFLFLVLLFLPAFSQVLSYDSVFSSDDGPLLQPKKFDYHVTLGSQFTSVSGFGSALNTYITPRISYNVNKRLSIGGGISIIQTNYFQARSFYQNEQTPYSNGNFTSAMVFIDGQYIVNKRLTIYGSAYKQIPITQDPLPYNPFNPVSSKGAQGVNFNVGYRIGEHMYIQAGFRYSEGTNPYYNDPFNRNPFMNDSFGSPSCFGVPRW
jgi:hypothetical protein